MDFRDLFGIREEEQQPQWTPIPSATDRATPPPLPLRKDEVELEARMNAINNTLKNWDAAMKLREAMQQPVQDNSPQAQNLRQAEEDLQQAKEEDAQSGSEGYEKKEDGIFSRMANWGSSVGEYLFGKSTPEEEAKIVADKERMSLLGYYGKMANDTLETMARSPFSKFVDPTTLLGGQQSMVENIDADYQNRGLHSLRRELLEQDRARMGTTIGQAQEYARIMNDPNVPEEQKAAITQYMQRNAKSGLGALSYPKTQEQAYLRDLADFESQTGRKATRDEQVKMAQYHGAESPEALFAGTPKKPTINDLDDFILQEAINRAEEKGTEVADELPGVSQEVTGDPNYLFRPKTYQSQSATDKQIGEFRRQYGNDMAAAAKEVNGANVLGNIYRMNALLNKIDELENEGLVGGLMNTSLSSLGDKLGWTDKQTSEFLADFNAVSADVQGQMIRLINQAGATNQYEQELARDVGINLDKSIHYNKQRIINAMNGLSLMRARILDEAFLAERGLPSFSNKRDVSSKYDAAYRNIDKRIDPNFLDRNIYKQGVYVVKNGKLLFQVVEEG